MRLRTVLLACVVAALGPAAAARAATTVGSDLSKPATDSLCATACTAFAVATGTTAPVAVAPSDGVVVRWRVKAGLPASNVALQAMRPSAGGTYVGVGASELVNPPAGVSTFLTRIPVQAGDVIGADMGGGARIFAANTADDVRVFNPQLGGFAMAPNDTHAHFELLANADIEPDVDGDGYGDETQDLCPTDPTRHTACLSNLTVSVQPEPAPLTVGRPLTFTITVSNAGPSPAQDVGLVANFPSSATPLQARASARGTCGGAYTITCRFGTIDKDGSVTAVLTVRPEAVGTLVMNATASTSTAESSTDDDTFTSDVTVLAPTLRLLELRLTRPVIRVGGTTTIRWYQTDTAPVTVSVQQISRRGRILPRGSFVFTGRPGSNALAFRGRIPHRARLKPGTYRFTVSAATADGRVAAPQHLGFSVHRRGW